MRIFVCLSLASLSLALPACGDDGPSGSEESSQTGGATDASTSMGTDTTAPTPTTAADPAGSDESSTSTSPSTSGQDSTGPGGVPMMVFEGSVTIENAEDVQEMLLYTHITGDLTINAPGIEAVELPHLQEVGELLTVVEDPIAGCQDIHFPELQSAAGFDFEGDQFIATGRRCAIELPSLNGVERIVFNAGISRVDLASADNLEVNLWRADLERLDLSGMTTGALVWGDSSVAELHADALGDAYVHLSNHENSNFELPNATRVALEVTGNGLTSVSFPQATDIALSVWAATDLATISAPSATHFDNISVRENPALSSLDLPALSQVREPEWADLFVSIAIYDNPSLSNCDLQTIRDNLDPTFVEYSSFADNNSSSCSDPQPLPASPYINNCTWEGACGGYAPGGDCDCDPDCSSDGFVDCCSDQAALCG